MYVEIEEKVDDHRQYMKGKKAHLECMDLSSYKILLIKVKVVTHFVWEKGRVRGEVPAVQIDSVLNPPHPSLH